MTANQIAKLIALTARSHSNCMIDSKETADLVGALLKTAEERGLHEETVTALRELNLLNYEAPANG